MGVRGGEMFNFLFSDLFSDFFFSDLVLTLLFLKRNLFSSRSVQFKLGKKYHITEHC